MCSTLQKPLTSYVSVPLAISSLTSPETSPGHSNLTQLHPVNALLLEKAQETLPPVLASRSDQDLLTTYKRVKR